MWRFGCTKTAPSPTLFVANLPAKCSFERIEAGFLDDPGIVWVRRSKKPSDAVIL